MAFAGEFELQLVQKYCVHLRRVVSKRTRCQEPLIELLCARGRELEFASLSFNYLTKLGYSASKRLRRECPNALYRLFDLACYDDLGILSNRVVHLTIQRKIVQKVVFVPIDYRLTPIDVLQVGGGLEKLRKVVLVKAKDQAHQILEAIISLGRPPLRHIVVGDRSTDPRATLEALRDATELRWLNMLASRLPGDEIFDFVQSVPHLERLELGVSTRRDSPTDIAHILQACLALQHLKVLRIFSVPTERRKYNEVIHHRNLCRPYRSRRVAIQIYGIHYFR